MTSDQIFPFIMLQRNTASIRKYLFYGLFSGFQAVKDFYGFQDRLAKGCYKAAIRYYLKITIKNKKK